MSINKHVSIIILNLGCYGPHFKIFKQRHKYGFHQNHNTSRWDMVRVLQTTMEQAIKPVNITNHYIQSFFSQLSPLSIIIPSILIYHCKKKNIMISNKPIKEIIHRISSRGVTTLILIIINDNIKITYKTPRCVRSLSTKIMP